MHPLLALVDRRRHRERRSTDGSGSNPIVADGAMATMLQTAGVDAGRPPELASTDAPLLVDRVHTAYLAAGAELLMTNSFGANEVRLRSAGLGDRAAAVAPALAAAAATVARRVAERHAAQWGGERPLVAGSIGPLGLPGRPFASLDEAGAEAAFGNQAAALAGGGADLAWVETVSSADEVVAALAGIRAASGLPVVVTVAVDGAGGSPGGARWTELARLLASFAPSSGLVAWGVNCGPGPGAAEQAILDARAIAPDAVLVARPSAGLPAGGPDPLGSASPPVWPVGPAAFAHHAQKLILAGADLVGGCCGTTPTHIAAVATAVAATVPGHRRPSR